jgi:hypothetical protein
VTIIDDIATVTKQLNDKERVAAAMESPALMKEINRCLASAHLRGRKLVIDD